ncbi:hypothetical protein RUM44_013081 [Polyplax serrata]|uniref:Transmembrane protein 183 n=1 Tax=Polyplax serrata TaxID=468196 RepID=A0ABR1BGX8_POLSC
MSRFGNKGCWQNRKKFSKVDLCDVTINDFANSCVVSGTDRMKKNKIRINRVVKEVEDDKTWEDKLHNLNTDSNEVKQDTSIKKLGSHRKKKTVTLEVVNNESGIDYPIDIWFLISEYILPEDVGKFAAICKTSLAVVSSAKFWFNLYKRYYKWVPNLPQQFLPECMVRRYGLRAHVIRALHFMYPPFIAKLKSQVLFEGDPHLLTKRLCVLAWCQKIKNYWLFYFKLKQTGLPKSRRGDTAGLRKPGLLELLEDITANVDDNCKVLKVTCLNYIILPMLSGQVLSSVSLNVGQGMTYHKLQLNFGTGPCPNMSTQAMILEPVVNVQILDWWHPSFPHSDGLNTNFYSLETAAQQFDDLEF